MPDFRLALVSTFAGKRGLVLGVANKRSIAWAIARRLAEGGAQLAFTFQGERIEAGVRELAETVDSPLVTGCDVRSNEDLARVFYTTYRLETVCLRFFNVYGPRQDGLSEHGGVVARFIAHLLQGKTPVVYGDGKQSRDFTYVSDAVDAVRLACTAPKAEGEVFNVGTGSRVTVGGLLNIIGTLLERELTPTYADPRNADIRHSLGEVTKAQEVLGSMEMGR